MRGAMRIEVHQGQIHVNATKGRQAVIGQNAAASDGDPATWLQRRTGVINRNAASSGDIT